MTVVLLAGYGVARFVKRAADTPGRRGAVPDEPPRSGTWRPMSDAVSRLTEAELAELHGVPRPLQLVREGVEARGLPLGVVEEQDLCHLDSWP